MRLKSIVINNLYSFGEGVLCTFPLEDYTKVLIVGVNNDEAGADSNGAGKSAVLNCIFWTLFGEIFQSKENVDEIVRKGQKNGSATLTLIEGESEIVINRGRGNKKFLKLCVDGKDLTCNTDNQTQSELLKHLNIAPSLKPAEYVNDFLNTCYFSSDTAKGFMAKETTSAQRFALVERYLGLKRYTLASDMAREKRKGILTKIEGALSDIAAKEIQLAARTKEAVAAETANADIELNKTAQNLEAAQKSIEANKERTQLQQQITTIQANLDQMRTSIVRELDGLEQQYNTMLGTAIDKRKDMVTWTTLKDKVLQQEAKAVDLAEGQRKQNEYAETINTEALRLTAEIGVLNSEVKTLQEQLTIHYKCPQCQASLMFKDNALHPINVDTLAEKLAETEKKKDVVRTRITELRAQLAGVKTTMDANNEVLQKYKYDKEVLRTTKDGTVLEAEIVATEKQAALIRDRHAKIGEDAEQKVSLWKEGLKNLEEKLKGLTDTGADLQKAQAEVYRLTVRKDELNRNIGNLQQELKQIQKTEAELDELRGKTSTAKARADVYGFWETGFKEIKVNIIDEFLPDFEDKVNDFLKRLKVDMKVDFGTQKQKASVTKKDLVEGRAFKEEFNVEVYKGGDLHPFGMLSKGQRGRIGSCVGMALRELTKERGSNRFDFFFMDEIADSLDESGLRELVSLLDEASAQKLVISHNDALKNYFETITTVEMTDGVSTIHTE